MRHHIVDTFADATHLGNPAAVVELPEFAPTAEMQDSAHRIGLPTTAFVVAAAAGQYRVRWFTPYKELNLCGHATIAATRVLLGDRTRLTFVSDNGVLHAERIGDLVSIDLPAAALTACDPPPELLAALGVRAVACVVSSDDILIEVESAAVVAAIRPDFAALARQPYRGHIVTARGADDVDFTSRTFFPALGVDEDQVCVTAHCKLTPYWGRRLGRNRLTATQLSRRGGRLAVRDAGDRVHVLGSAVLRGACDELPELLEERR
ncbi:PhzF family phenazine biosynthesis protein [Nocardia sp. BMG111209]|uniref:PhzF family phenazine biosynthesis protein n=1 Tax=Nocardia sp. BMG111209 TaxID=1160137 RepID=UPI00035D5BCC|nr:PhzF family phenazine biosynthesis protein [Nocardia sp. BMG111209]